MATFRDCPNCNCGEGGRFVRRCRDNHEFCTVCGAGPFGEFCPICDSRGIDTIGGVVGKIAFPTEEDEQSDESDDDDNDDDDVEDDESDDDGREGEDEAGSDDSGYDYSGGSTTYSPQSRSVQPESSGGGFGALLVVAAAIATLFYSISNNAPTSPSAASPTESPPPEPTTDGPWERSVALSQQSISLDELSLSADWSLVADGIALSQPLRYADRDAPRDAVWSSTSSSGRYRFVTLCDRDWCNDARLIDRQRERMVHVPLTDVGASAGVAWSPDDRYALIKWSHAGTSGVIALDLENLSTTGTSESLPSSIFGDEPGNIGNLPNGVTPESPSLRFDLTSAAWLDQRTVELEVEVVKTVWTTVDGNSGAGSPTSGGSVRLRFSVPSLEGVVVGRTLPPDSPAGDDLDKNTDAAAEVAVETAPVGELSAATSPDLESTAVPQEPVAPLRREPVRVGGSIAAPPRLTSVVPVYPAIAKMARVSGTVVLEITIGVGGSVEDVRILKSVPLLDEAATNAVRQWTYSPTVIDGVVVPVVMAVGVQFKLD